MVFTVLGMGVGMGMVYREYDDKFRLLEAKKEVREVKREVSPKERIEKL